MRLLLSALKGVVVAEAVSGLFVLVLTALALHAELSVELGDASPVADTLALWPTLALLCLPVGIALGALAARAREHRRLTLLLAAGAGYVIVSVAAVLWPAHDAPAEDLGALLLLGLWAAVAYAVFAGPPLLAGALLLERWTR